MPGERDMLRGQRGRGICLPVVDGGTGRAWAPSGDGSTGRAAVAGEGAARDVDFAIQQDEGDGGRGGGTGLGLRRERMRG